MGFWWWVLPVVETGIVCAVISLFIAICFEDSDLAIAIASILMLPFLAAIGSVAVWGVCQVFWWIWGPYFG